MSIKLKICSFKMLILELLKIILIVSGWLSVSANEFINGSDSTSSTEPETTKQPLKLSVVPERDNYAEVFKALQEASPFATLDKALEAPMKILAVIESKYGLRVYNDRLEACANEYSGYKEQMSKEDIFFRYCVTKLSSDKMDMYRNISNLSTKDIQEMDSLAVLCGGDFRLTMIKYRRLFYKLFGMSYKCMTELVRDTFDVLYTKHYFRLMLKDIDLKEQELKFLIQVANNSVAKESINNTNKSLLKNYNNEIRTLLNETEKKAWAKKVQEFEKVLAKTPVMEEGSWKEFKTLSDYMQINVFDAFLKIRKNENDSSPNLRDIVNAHYRLQKLILNVSNILTKSKISVGQSQLSNEIQKYSNFSATLGMHCASSPNHPVGSCTPENHEICSAPEADLYFVSYLLPVTRCQCGYNMDCVHNILKRKKHNGRKTRQCRLFPNPQSKCLGGLGYPCKSFPLVPELNNESCMTGYCNQKLDECQTDPDLEKIPKKKNNLHFQWFGFRRIFL